MSHLSWHIKQENQDKLDLSDASINAAYAIEQEIRNKSKDMQGKINKGITLLDLLTNDKYDNDILIDNIKFNLREIYSLNAYQLNEKINGIKDSIKNQEYNENEINLFLNIYDAVKKIPLQID